MGYGAYLQELLRPLGVYDLRAGSLSASELEAMGMGLDGAAGASDYAQRECVTATAEEEGLSRRESLFAHPPVQVSVPLRREAIHALLQISGDSFTLDAINRAIQGCGIKAEAQETGVWGYIRVIFPEVAGVPEEFEQIQQVILDIIPCHLETEFYFRYLTWAELEERQMTWAMIHEAGYTWHTFELAV